MESINKPALKTGIERKLEEEKIRNKISNWWKEHYAKTFKNYTFEGYSGHYMEISTIVSLVQYFFELGLNFQTKDMQDALRMEYEKGRADVIAKTLEWINVFNDNNYIMQYSDSCEHPINEIIEWYKNYINRE